VWDRESERERECVWERERPAATAVTVAGRETLRRPEAPRMNEPACGALPSSVKYTCVYRKVYITLP